MSPHPLARRRRLLRAAVLASAPLALTLIVNGCSKPGEQAAVSAMPAHADTADPRAHLKAGYYDAGVAAKGMELVAHQNKPAVFKPDSAGVFNYANSDLAFGGHYVYQGNFSGFQVWDVSDPTHPKLTAAPVCFTEQGDVSVYGHLLFVSAENTGSRLDCGSQGIKDTVSKERMIGVRIFDVSNPAKPRQVADVQTCRGSHTHTLVQDLKDPSVIYVYVSGLARVRSIHEMAGCEAGDISDPNSALFRIEVIRVPLAHPEQAKIVSSPRIFNDLVAPVSHGVAYADTANGAMVKSARRMLGRLGMDSTATAADSDRAARLLASLQLSRDDSARASAYADSLEKMGLNARFRPTGRPNVGPSQCHDITVYPEAGLAGGACSGYGLLLDIHDPVHPKRLQAMADSNFSFWHSATFNNAATTMLFTDEWGGGTQAKCRATDPIDWGADAIFTITNHDSLTHVGYFKMPAAQTTEENCVAHNGGLVPVPGRDIMVQGWYQGGISVYDFTDPAHPKEIAYFDRGPIDSTKLVLGGFWAGYYYNGYIYGSAISRGFDVFKLTPTADLTQNEIDAAATIHMDQYNPQDQPKLVWPAAFPVARAYVDQLVRDNGLSSDRTSAIRTALDNAEKASGAARATALQTLATQLDQDAAGAGDAHRVKLLAGVVREMSQQK